MNIVTDVDRHNLMNEIIDYLQDMPYVRFMAFNARLPFIQTHAIVLDSKFYFTTSTNFTTDFAKELIVREWRKKGKDIMGCWTLRFYNCLIEGGMSFSRRLNYKKRKCHNTEIAQEMIFGMTFEGVSLEGDFEPSDEDMSLLLNLKALKTK